MAVLTNSELKKLAKQLSCPEGEMGILTGEKMNNSNIGMTVETINAINFQKGDNVLELGHGNAGHLQLLFEQAKNIKYFGLEISPTMVTEATNKNINLVNEQSANFELFDGMFISYESNFFQKIFTVNTIYFWKKPRVLLIEIYRVLQKGGTLTLTFAKKDFMNNLPFVQFGFQLWDIPDVLNLTETIGFRHLNTLHFKDIVESKNGDLVNREYVVIKFERL